MNDGKLPDGGAILDELQTANRLMILSLVRSGIQQKDIAATLQVSESVLSRMFPKGLLKRIAQLAKTETGHGMDPM